MHIIVILYFYRVCICPITFKIRYAKDITLWSELAAACSTSLSMSPTNYVFKYYYRIDPLYNNR